MQKITQKSVLTEYGLQELSEAQRKLISKAEEARDKAYAPYSGFAVGSAILLESGNMVLGSNQENAAYPSGLCAERTALFYTGANYPSERIESLAISVSPGSNHFPFPCGSCLQVMWEYQQKQSTPIVILIKHPSGDSVLVCNGVENFLPFAFGKEHLGE